MATLCLQQRGVLRSSCEVPHTFAPQKKKTGISRKIFIEVPSIKFHANRPVGDLLILAERQTDRRKDVRTDGRTEGRTDMTKAIGSTRFRATMFTLKMCVNVQSVTIFLRCASTTNRYVAQ